MHREDSRVVIITGGTGGLGRALAAVYIAKGDHVVVTSRSEAKLREMQSAFAPSKQLHIYKLDVTQNDAVRAFCAWVQIRFGRCDLLYNNAGTAVFKPFVEMSLKEIAENLRPNLDGTLLMTRAFLPMMLSAKKGHLVNIASLAGQVATSKAAVYAASKAAVIRFSEGLRHELAGSGVSVTCVLPGPIDTAFLDTADSTGQYREKVRKFLLTPVEAARIIERGVERKKPELALPFRLKLLSTLYFLLPHWLKQLAAPLLNRK